jgi:hypothetical protein
MKPVLLIILLFPLTVFSQEFLGLTQIQIINTLPYNLKVAGLSDNSLTIEDEVFLTRMLTFNKGFCIREVWWCDEECKNTFNTQYAKEGYIKTIQHTDKSTITKLSSGILRINITQDNNSPNIYFFEAFYGIGNSVPKK